MSCSSTVMLAVKDMSITMTAIELPLLLGYVVSQHCTILVCLVTLILGFCLWNMFVDRRGGVCNKVLCENTCVWVGRVKILPWCDHPSTDTSLTITFMALTGLYQAIKGTTPSHLRKKKVVCYVMLLWVGDKLIGSLNTSMEFITSSEL